jgi:hypothetical protein
MERQVRRIYLDNSHLHLLSELRRTNSSRFASFLKVWAAQHCALALSQTHLSEINRYEDQLKREARYELLEALMPIHSDIPIDEWTPYLFLSLTNREIFAALLNRGVISLKDPTFAHLANAFPNALTSKNHVDLLKGLSTMPIYHDLLNAFYQASEVAASANSRPPNTKYEIHRLSQIPNAGLDADIVSDVMRGLDEAENNTGTFDGLSNLVGKEDLKRVFSELKDKIESFSQQTAETGALNALAEYLGTDPTDTSSLDELIVQHTFDFCVRQFVTELCGDEDDNTISNLSGQVKLEDCPGTWLKHAVRLQLRKAMPIDHASNYYDLEHLSYLPYVDRLFADKRVAHCAAHVLSSGQIPTSVKGVRAPISLPNSVEALEAAFCSPS